MRLDRGALHFALAAAALSLLTACGGNAAPPTVTPAATTSSAAVPAPSPPRPPLASPIASPSAVVSATTPAATSTQQVAGQSYDVKSGDTLAIIAQQFYGDPTLWRTIYDANKDTIGADPDKLSLGMHLTIPPKPST